MLPVLGARRSVRHSASIGMAKDIAGADLILVYSRASRMMKRKSCRLHLNTFPTKGVNTKGVNLDVYMCSLV
ncbi:hypothetical protein vseg_015458 [Gypsophila vaccaria]